jgi:SAM-dependent methyltransferase
LEYIRHCAKENGFENIKIFLAAEDAPNLLCKSIDLIFMQNACHHLKNRVERFKKLKNALKPNGRIDIIEYKSGGGCFSFHRRFGH